MDNLCAGICSSFRRCKEGSIPRGYIQRRTALHLPGHGGRLAMESVAALSWTGWQLCYGIGGSFAVESVAAFAWNRWQLCRGIRTRPKFAKKLGITIVFVMNCTKLFRS